MVSIFPLPQPIDHQTFSTAFQLRVAAAPDLLHLADLLTESFHPQEGLVKLLYPILRLGIYEDLKQRLNAKSRYYVCLAASLKNCNTSTRILPEHCPEILIGTVELGLRSRYPWQRSTSPQYLYISNLAVHLRFRRLGVAQQLLQYCEQIAQSWGFSLLCLHVLENNQQARQLYAKAGYQIREVDWSLTSVLFGQPRQLLLYKHLKTDSV
ncbi:MAG: GNAT family N-acetyltransferase [Microcoleaceae cyanobacterium]